MRTLLTTITLVLASSTGWAQATPAPIYDRDLSSAPEATSSRDRLVLSALGPSSGKGAGSVGLTMLLFIPSLDLRYVHALGDRFALDASVSTLGIASFGRIAGRLRLLGNESFSLATRIGASGTASVLADGGGAYAIAPTGGLLASFGSKAVQVTLAVDGGAGYGHWYRTGLTPQGEATLGVEIPVSSNLNLLVAGGCGLVFFPAETLVMPKVTFGIAL